MTTASPLPPLSGYQKFRLKARPLWESLYPLVLCVAAGVVSLNWLELSDRQASDLLHETIATAISVASILAGFQAIAQAIMLAIMESSTIEFLKRTGHFAKLVQYLWRAILWLLTFVGVALTFQVCDHAGLLDKWSRSLVIAIPIGLFIGATAACFRITRLMFRAMTLELSQQGRPPICRVKESPPVH